MQQAGGTLTAPSDGTLVSLDLVVGQPSLPWAASWLQMPILPPKFLWKNLKPTLFQLALYCT